MAASAGLVRYVLPPCPLGYEVLVREKSYMDDAPQFDTERFMTIQATAQKGRMQLAAVVIGRSLRDGVRGRGRPDDEYAPPLLETDGLAWTEREGPTWLFSDVGAQGGLAWFFPTLPPSADRGASVTWNVPYASGQSTAALRAEAARGRRAGFRERIAAEAAAGEKEVVVPTILTKAEIVVDETHEESGVRVTTYRMTGERRDESSKDADFPLTTVKSYKGTYAVTAAGRILRALVESRRTTTTGSKVPGSPEQRMVDDTDARMHLVRACDGPVAPPLEPKLTAEEKAAQEGEEDDGPRIVLPPPPRKKR